MAFRIAERAHGASQTPAVSEVMVHRGPLLLVRVPPVPFPASGLSSGAFLLEAFPVPHRQHPPAGIAEFADHVRGAALVSDVQVHGPVTLLLAVLRHKGVLLPGREVQENVTTSTCWKNIEHKHLKPVRDATRAKGVSATRPAGKLLRNSITIRKVGDELDGLPGNVEADTVAHCGPSLRGEFCRTLTVVDFATGWTENASARNNAYKNLSRAEALIERRLPFAIRSYDHDNGSEFANLDFIAHLQAMDVEQTRSRPYKKNDQATVESRNNHIVRRHAFYYRYELAELDLLNELWELVRVKANLFTPSKKPVERANTRDGRPRRVYDRPVTPWERLKRLDEEDRANGGEGYIKPGHRERIERILAVTNPAELVRRVHDIQDRLEQAALPRTKRLERKLGPDMAYLDKTLARIAGVDTEENSETPASEG